MEETKKQRFINWIKNPYTIAFLVILIIGIIIRLKYLFINQGIWWDELEYLAAGKALFGLMEHTFDPIKAFLFPGLIGLIFSLGFSEGVSLILIRIFLEFIPSVALMIGVYWLGAEISHNKKIGLIAMALMAVFWVHLFNMARVMSDAMANCFEIFALATFVAFWINKKKPHLLWVSVMFGVLGFLTRYSVALILPIMLLYLILTERTRIFKNKNVWIAMTVGVGMFLIYFFFNYIMFGNIWPAAWHYIFSPVSGVSALASMHGVINNSFITSVNSWLIWPLGLFCLLGLTIFFVMFIGIDKVFKQTEDEDSKKIKPLFFLFLYLSIFAYFWIFIWHITTSRWAMGLAGAIFVITAYGFYFSYEIIISLLSSFKIKKEDAVKVGTIIIGIILIFSMYNSYIITDRSIKYKSWTYGNLEDASYWLNSNVPPSETIMFASRIWYQYYTENKNFITDKNMKTAAFTYRDLVHIENTTVPFGMAAVCEYDYDTAIKNTDIDYFVWSIWQQVWSPSLPYIQKNINEGILIPVQYLEPVVNWAQGIEIPSVMIFKINKTALSNKLESLDYENQLIVAVNMEDWDPWNTYKQQMNITEKDICGYVHDKDGGKFYNDNKIERIHED